MLSGKRWGQPLLATSMAGRRKRHLLYMYVTDCESRLLFLVDTGAEVWALYLPLKLRGKTDNKHLAFSQQKIHQ